MGHASLSKAIWLGEIREAENEGIGKAMLNHWLFRQVGRSCSQMARTHCKLKALILEYLALWHEVVVNQYFGKNPNRIVVTEKPSRSRRYRQSYWKRLCVSVSFPSCGAVPCHFVLCCLVSFGLS